MKHILKYTIIVFFAILITRVLVPPKSMNLTSISKSSSVYESPHKTRDLVHNIPKHASSFAGVPINIVIELDRIIDERSTISIVHEGQEYNLGNTTIDSSGSVMRRRVMPDAPDGIYTVFYSSCGVSSDCYDGSFQFSIERTLSGNFEDHLGRPDIPPDIHIAIEDNFFVPKKIRVRKFTRVIWTNNGTKEHSVVTDNHYFTPQHSEPLQPGDAYELVFSETGEYPYHDGLHPDTITGSMLVED